MADADAAPSQGPPDPETGFEAHLADVSRALLDAGADRVDSAIRDALHVVGSFADADRAWLVAIDVEPPWLARRYEWHAEGIAPYAQAVDDDYRRRFAWSTRHIVQGGTLHVRDPRELPHEAAPEREDLLRRGVASLLGIPVLSDGALIGYLSIEHLSRGGGWSERTVERLRLLAELFACGLRRLRSEQVLARQRAGEARLADLSRRLLALGPRETPHALRWALAEVAGLAGVDRSFLLCFGPERQADWAFHEWCAEGVASAAPESRPWAAARILAGEVLHVPDPSALPAEAAAEREDLESRGVRSLLGIPALSGDRLVGFLGLEAMRAPREWREQEITLLRLAAELFANALRRQHAEQALGESQAQLLQAQKMDALGRLAGGVAHDFNNLLTVIAGHCEMLRKALDHDATARADVDEIHRAAERAASLTRRLLTFGRREPAARDPVDLNAVAAGMRGLLERLLGHDIELAVHAAPEPLVVCADAHQLEQALLNLALNGRDAMPDGGRLEVAVAAHTPDAGEAQRLRLEEDRPYAMLTVSDSGHGMDELTRARVFEPFFTTKDPGAGTGLGLSIVYGIARQHGGAVEVRSRPGEGSCFSLWVPLVAQPPRRDVPPPAPAGPSGDGGAHLLLVEDEPAVRKLVRRVLEHAGYRVTEATDGADGLVRAAALGPALGGVVSDVAMPRMTGPELVARLRRERPGLPALLLSGCPSAVERSAARPQDEVLAKPFASARLLARVRAMLERD